MPHKAAVGVGQEASTASVASGFRALGPNVEPDLGTMSKDQSNLGQEGQAQEEPAPRKQAGWNKLRCRTPAPTSQ